LDFYQPLAIGCSEFADNLSNCGHYGGHCPCQSIHSSSGVLMVTNVMDGGVSDGSRLFNAIELCAVVGQ
jgi:hypothetical protein